MTANGVCETGRMPLKACINGARRPSEHAALPVSAEQAATEALAVLSAGADGVHLHVKDEHGADTLAAQPLALVLDAVSDKAPNLPIGVTTGAWALPDPAARIAAIRSWDKRPDFASVNWHEDGADEVARALLDLGVEVEAGLWHEAAVDRWARSPVRDDCVRVLLELPDGPGPSATVAMARQLLARVRPVTGDRIPVLLHGEGSSCWPALKEAARLGLPTRIGLEDTLVLPDGSPAPDNAALVHAALRLIDAERSLG
ncbi:3-keto-5-aminohexanoate cleavage protein [Arthrobacter sp. RCC_34]|uniref:3-keto-5-aminohexanoate cleavage protein n=1 Tax=Arthrobacter sp. RCC_34 TaxID=3239230 RepID=UPI0035265F27